MCGLRVEKAKARLQHDPGPGPARGPISLNSYLGALGTDRPLIYFLPAATIVVLATSFFWITLGQWMAAVPRPDGQLTVSAGIAGLRNGESVLQTLHRADLAMLKAKQSGRDTVCVADEAL